MSDEGGQGESSGKVVDMAGRSGKRGRGRPPSERGDGEEPKLNKDFVLGEMWHAMIRGPDFPERWHVYRVPDGTRLLLREDDPVGAPGVVRVAKVSELQSAISSYSASRLRASAFAIGAKKALEMAKHFEATAHALAASPSAVSWQGEADVTFHRLPWPRAAAGAALDPSPTWDGLIGRMKNAAAFMAFVGSMFAPDADHQQYCWVYGEGQDGKGAINRFLARLFGSAYLSKQVPNKGREHFWAYNLIGKRCVVFPDCNDRRFVTSALFKSLVGRDPLEMEAKGQVAFTALVEAYFLFFSNEKPAVSSQRSDQRRLILCEFDPNHNPIDPDFESRLWREGGAFIAQCIAAYVAQNPAHGPIATDEAANVECADTTEFEFEAVFDAHFVVNRHESAKNLWITGPTLNAVLSHRNIRDTRKSEFIRWLERQHGIRRGTVMRDNVKHKVYTGLCSAAGPADMT